MRILSAILLASAAMTVALPGRAMAESAQSCASMAETKLAGFDLTVTKAAEVPAGEVNTPRLHAKFPAYCRIDGSIDPHTGIDGKAYAIGFSLALPDDWNGRFLFQGGGGLDGVVRPPFGEGASGDDPALARGFAVVSTNSGHEAKGFDGSFKNDQKAGLDFAYVAIGRVTVLAKDLITAYYGKPIAHSYFVGCSTGGREGMTSSERYPYYFDGIVVGAPAMRTHFSNLAIDRASALDNRIAPKGADGQPVTDMAFSPSDRTLVLNTLLDQCDKLDGLADGMIEAPLACHFDPSVLTCKGEKTDKCLTGAEVDTLKQAFEAPKNSLGQTLYSAHPYDTGMAMAPKTGIPGFMLGSLDPITGPNHSTTIDVDAQELAARADALQVLIDTWGWTNLSSFRGHGGKIMYYHGLSDPWFSAFDTLNYFRRMEAANGGAAEAAKFSRFYLVPGMGHCGGGPATLDQFDMLTKIVDWVEKDQAPASVTATGTDYPGRSRPLCPYPTYARYEKGDANKAASFTCAEYGADMTKTE